jgi:hypothetical protein
MSSSHRVRHRPPPPPPPALVRVGLVNKAQLKHRSNALGKTDTDPSRDKAGHNQIGFLAITDLIYHSLSESDFEGGREVYMVGQGEQPTEKTTEEIAHEADEEMA